VMLKGFAISSLGVFIFLIFFFSWEAFKFYYDVIKMVVLAIYRRDLSALWGAAKMLWASSTDTLAGASDLTLTMKQQDEERFQYEQDEEEREETQDNHPSSDEDSSSSRDASSVNE